MRPETTCCVRFFSEHIPGRCPRPTPFSLPLPLPLLPSPFLLCLLVCSGDNNDGDDIPLYAKGQLWLNQENIVGRAIG